MPNGTHQPIIVTHEGGVRFAAQIRTHRVVVDQPQHAGGTDSGPMPIELLGTALGTCIAYYVQQFLHARSLPSDGMRVEVEQYKASNPNRIGTFVARVVLPAPLPGDYAAQLERVVRSCPAHGTLAQAARVAIMVETAVADAA